MGDISDFRIVSFANWILAMMKIINIVQIMQTFDRPCGPHNQGADLTAA